MIAELKSLHGWTGAINNTVNFKNEFEQESTDDQLDKKTASFSRVSSKSDVKVLVRGRI